MTEGSGNGGAGTAPCRPSAAGYGWSDLVVAGLIFVFAQWVAVLVYGLFGGEPPAEDAAGAGFLRGRYIAAVYTIAMVLCIAMLALYGRVMGRSVRLSFRAPGWASPIRILSGYLLLWCFSIAVEPLASLLPSCSSDMGSGGWFLVCSILAAPLFEEIIFRGFLTGGMRRAYGGVAAWIWPAVVFAAVHISPAGMVSALAGGLVLGFYYLRYRSLVIVIVLHALNNMTACFLDVVGAGDLTVRDLAGGTWVATAVYAVCGVISAAALVRMCVLVRRIKKEDCTAAE